MLLTQQRMLAHYAAAKADRFLMSTWSVSAAGTYLLKEKVIWRKNRISALLAVSQNTSHYLGMRLSAKNADMFTNQDDLGSYHINSSTLYTFPS